MFDTVAIQSARNGSSVVNGYREDLAAGDLVQLRLSSRAGISSYRWEIQGRPEKAQAGGAGPEPVVISRSPEASFRVDPDITSPSYAYMDGTYLVACIVNEGGITETRITTTLVRLSSSVLSDGRSLRHVAQTEDLEDTGIALVRQGWATDVNRWLRYLATVVASQPGPSYYGYRQVNTGVTKGVWTGPNPDFIQAAGQNVMFSDTQPSNSPVANQIYATPIYLWKPLKLADVWVNPTSGFYTINCSMALYDNISGGAYPGNRLWHSEFVIPAGGGYYGHYDDATIRGPGLFWLALVMDSGVTNGFSYWPWFRPGDGTWPLIGYGALTQISGQDYPGVAWTHAFTYAALPDPFPSSAPAVVPASNFGFPAPWVRFKETS